MNKAEVSVAVVLGLVVLATIIRCPIYSTVSKKSELHRSLQHAKSIALVLRVYAQDHEGRYPQGDDANRCFAQLVDEIATEKIFYVRGSAWHGSGATAAGPDNLWEQSEPPGIALDAGENGYAFNRQANDNCREDMPLIASGFSRTIGTYGKKVGQLGGVWAKKKVAIVIYGDGSGETPRLDKNRQVTREGKNIFLAPDCEMLNPALP